MAEQDQLITPLMRIEVDLADVLELGKTSEGQRRMIAIVGGTFSGRIQGKVLPGGADWQLIRNDGIADISARYPLETTGGARIEVRSDGYRHGPPEVIARLARGEDVDPASYYFRTMMRFETADPELAWLNGILGFSTGRRRAKQVVLDVFEIL